jgi:hypothetical protein
MSALTASAFALILGAGFAGAALAEDAAAPADSQQ